MVFDIEWPFETKRSKNRILAKKIAWIPFYEKIDNRIFIYLDYRISKYIYKAISEFTKREIEFFFISPRNTDPHINPLDFDTANIFNYLQSFVIEDFYFNFERIKFDLLQNMVKYSHEMNCFEKIKPIYDKLIKEKYMKSIQCSGHHVTKRYKEEIIKNRFINLWREIMLSNLDV